MKKLIAVGACFLILLVGGVLWLFKKDNPEPQQTVNEPTPSVSAADSKKETPVTDSGYTVKNYKGNIAVFEQGKDAPFRTTGIAVKELPPADRALLDKGINASDQEELNLILEDYCS